LAACEDEQDIAKDDPGERRGPTEAGVSRVAVVETSVVLLPLAKKAADTVGRPAGVSVDIKATSSDDALTSLCAGKAEVALSNRAISDAERQVCEQNGLDPVRSLAAHQVVALYREKGLDIRCLTVKQLRKLWRPESEVQRYSELGPGLPDRPVRLITYAPTSAAFELFGRRITGGEHSLRPAARRVADRLRFGRVVRTTPGALAVGPYGLPLLGGQGLGLVAVDAGRGCVRPSADAVQSGDYRPLSAPLFMYATRRSLEKVAVKSFVDYVLDEPHAVASYPGVVPPDPAEQPEAEPRR